jgi:hypothetical protein
MPAFAGRTLLHTGLGRAAADNIVIDEALTEIKRRT